MVKVSASILGSPDQSDLANTALFAQECGADFIHVDVMDGMFVEPTHYSSQTVREIAAKASLPIEVHLMVVEPSSIVEEYAKAGAMRIAVHSEAQPPEELIPLIKKIKSLGVKAGIALNPETKIKEIDPEAFRQCDFVLVMSVNPGWAGQVFNERAHEKIAAFEQLAGRNNWKMEIEVDGGINSQTAQECVSSGAKILVMGSAFYKAQDPKAALQEVKAIGEQ